jgi:hypothetical protein
MIDRKTVIARIRAKAHLNRLMTEAENGPDPEGDIGTVLEGLSEAFQTVRPRDYREPLGHRFS